MVVPVASGSSLGNTPSSLPPLTYTAQAHDTLQKIAQAHGLTPEELARANQIDVNATISDGQVLTLPANAAPPPPKEQLPSDASLQQQTSDAVTAYLSAAQQDKQSLQHLPRNARVNLADDETSAADGKWDAMSAAIHNEIAGEVANRNNGVPPQFRAPTDQLEAGFGQAIVQRYQGDPTTQAAVSECVASCLLQDKASALIATVPANADAHDKLQSLSTTLQGQPQNVITYALEDPNVQGWIQSEADLVAKPYATVKPGGEVFAYTQANDASAALLTATTGLSPWLAAAVTQGSMPTVQKIAQVQTSEMGAFDNMQGVLANLGSGDQASGLTQQIADAYAGNTTVVNNLANHGALEFEIPGASGGNPSFAFALSNSLRNLGQTRNADAIQAAGTQGQRDYLANSDTSPLKQYEAAHSAAAQADQTLSQLLAKTGPLDYTQNQAFIAAYHKDNQQVYAADAAAAKTLAAYMQDNQANLIFAAGHDPASAQQLYSAMQGLAQSGQGKVALQFAGYVQKDPGAAQAFTQFSDYQTRFLPAALESAQGQLLVENGGNTQSAAEALVGLAEPVFNGKAGWSQVKEAYPLIATNASTPRDAASFAKAYEEMGKSGKAWAAASISLFSFGGATSSQVSGMINAFATAGGDVTGITTGAMQVMAEAGKFGVSDGSAEVMASLGKKLVPGIGTIASTSAFVSDIQSARSNPNAAGAFYTLATVGDAISVIGSIVGDVPGLELPGEMVNGIGALMSAPFELIATAIGDKETQQTFLNEQLKYLKAAHFSDADAALMAKDGTEINAFSEQVGITNPDDAQQILRDHPEAFGEDASHTQGVIDVVKACQIAPSDVGGFLSAMRADNPTYPELFRNITMAPGASQGAPLSMAAELVGQINTNFPNAKAFVQARAPQVFSADGEARREADYQYETAQGGSLQTQMIGNLLAGNSNPAYQVEIISIMQKQGTLDNWVSQISAQSPQLYASARQAIQNARNANVLPADKTQQYLGELG